MEGVEYGQGIGKKESHRQRDKAVSNYVYNTLNKQMH